ncbi:trypsin-like peptidase domain-containing protein [Streptomyces sp. NPDC001948]
MTSPSLLAQRPSWLVRFPRVHGEGAAGAGVLVGTRHVVTCAHVLDKQFGREDPAPGRSPAAPAQVVEVEFPFAGRTGSPGIRMRATVVGWAPIAWDGSGDAALLELESELDLTPDLEPEPKDKKSVACTPAPLACPPSLSGHEFSVHGFPHGSPVARQVTGVLRGASGQEGPWVQLDPEGAAGWAIEVGFSGAPVFDRKRDAVVGIVVARDNPDTRTGHMLPMSYLRSLWPEVRRNCRWRLDLESSYEAHWQPRARGSEPDSSTDEWFFTGRTEARRVIHDWLAGEDPALAKHSVLLVTGGPGSGKSALLAHSLVSADLLLSKTVPHPALSDLHLPIGAFDVALHLRGHNRDDVTAQLARALDITGSDSGELLASVRKLPPEQPLTVLADAVEEAASLEDALQIASLLKQLATTGRVRVLAAVRTAPAGTGRERIFSSFGRDAWLVDLEDNRYLHRPDVTEYVVRRLTGDPRHSAAYQEYERDQLRAIGEAVARKARYNFLIAQLTTAWLIRRDEQEPGPGEAGWEDRLPTTVGDAMDTYLNTCGTDSETLRRLLTALAYARGDGLPRSDTWLRMADRLGPDGIRHSAEDREQIFQSAAHYLVERVNEGSRTPTYRLFHDALDQHLRKECEREHRATEAAIEARIAAVLKNAVPERDDECDWARADAYTRDHLASHAASGGQLDDLLTDTEYLVHATPRRLVPLLHRVQSEPARLAAAVYRTSLGIHARAAPRTRRQVLALDAARAGATELHGELIRRIPSGDWAPLWATGSSFTPSLRDTLTGRTGRVSKVTCSVLDGAPVAVAITDDRSGNAVEVWDLATGAPLANRTIPRCRALSTLPDGTPVAVTMGYDKVVQVWNLVTGAPIGKPFASHTDGLFDAACTSVDGTPVAVIAYADDSRRHRERYPYGLNSGLRERNVQRDDTVQVWNLTTGTPVSELGTGRKLQERNRTSGTVYPGLRTDRIRPVCRVACTVLGGKPVVVTGDFDGRVGFWNLATGTRLHGSFTGHWGREFNQVRDIAFTTVRGAPAAVTVGDDRTVRLWDLTTRAQFGKPLTGHAGGVVSVACTTVDGTPVAVTGGFDKTVRVWNLATCEPIGEPLTGHNDTVVDVACSVLDGTPVAVSGSSDGTVRVWNLTAGTPLGKPRPGHTGQVTSAAYTVVHGTPAAATAGEDGTVRLWNIATGTPLGNPLPSHTATVYDIACEVVNGTPAAITTGVDDGQRRSAARVWDLAAGIPLVPHWTPIDGARAVAWMDGIPVAMSDSVLSGDVRAVNLAARAPFGSPLPDHTRAPGKGAYGVACTMVDGAPIAITSDARGVRVWNLSTGTTLGEPQPKDSGRLVFSMGCASVDGTLIAVTGDTDGTVRMWNPTTGSSLDSSVAGHTDWVDAVMCAVLDGTPVAVTAGRDNTVRLWNLRTGEPLGLLPVTRPRAVALTPWGDLVVGTSNDVAVYRRCPVRTPHQMPETNSPYTSG